MITKFDGANAWLVHVWGADLRRAVLALASCAPTDGAPPVVEAIRIETIVDEDHRAIMRLVAIGPSCRATREIEAHGGCRRVMEEPLLVDDKLLAEAVTSVPAVGYSTLQVRADGEVTLSSAGDSQDIPLMEETRS
jgi:hypothetical protein